MSGSLQKRLLAGLVLLFVTVLGGAAGYYVIGGGEWAFGDCLYMTVITVTTVGYGETLSNMDKIEGARDFTMVLLLFGTGSIVFFASMITAFVVEGDLKNALYANKIKKRMRRMKDHVIVCGAGSTGRNVIEELIKLGRPVIAVDVNEELLKDIAEQYPKADFAYVVGDATDDSVQEEINMKEAAGLVAALSSDKDNLYLTVSARQENPKVRVVARCAEMSHVEKMRKAGADAVVSPNYIGGLRLVSEMVRPSVVRFLDEMMRDTRASYRIDEVTLGDGVGELGGSLRDAKIRERYGMTVLAVRAKEDATFTYNPDADQKISTGTTLVVLGSVEQVNKLRTATGS
jgi:voltage-gated potassium channel